MDSALGKILLDVILSLNIAIPTMLWSSWLDIVGTEVVVLGDQSTASGVDNKWSVPACELLRRKSVHCSEGNQAFVPIEGPRAIPIKCLPRSSLWIGCLLACADLEGDVAHTDFSHFQVLGALVFGSLVPGTHSRFVGVRSGSTRQIAEGRHLKVLVVVLESARTLVSLTMYLPVSMSPVTESTENQEKKSQHEKVVTKLSIGVDQVTSCGLGRRISDGILQSRDAKLFNDAVLTKDNGRHDHGEIDRAQVVWRKWGNNNKCWWLSVTTTDAGG